VNTVAIDKGFRFEIAFDQAFPQGLVMTGEVRADTEYQSREAIAKGQVARQNVDERTGKRQWKVAVTDLGESRAKRASFELILLADVQPVPTAAEVLPGMRPIELEGLTAEPRVGGQGEFKYQTYVFRATGFAAAGSGAAAKSSRSNSGSSASGVDGSKAA
jgi:hypothetical protein